MDLSRFKRLGLFQRPTPLEELPRLQQALGCKPRIFVKRDDLTQSGLGGNKNRKLDFLMADALAQDSDVIITLGGVQSNHCRQTAAVATKLGLECHLILQGEEPAVRQGNLLYNTILGVNIHFVPEDGDMNQAAQDLVAELKEQGRKPYLIPVGGSTPLGALGYVESTMEVIEQAKELGVSFGHAFLATGSAGTQAGAEVASRELYPAMKIHGVSVSRDSEPQKKSVAEMTNRVYALLGIEKTVTPDDIIVHDEYYGEKYAVPTQAGNDAIRLVAQTEAILLDPVYTGKAMSGMLDLLRKGQLDDAEAVLFFHTGGYPAVFAFAEYFQDNT
ncbi:MAG: D-cysteine desulfhydrase family protein [Bacillota bacterium]|nr:D-cysteine desulfhydrase family protein [Candidatus Fermentithermobacillaceae bacterium]HOA71419.1 D-cysteine desulfhydrase family protein [Bacillota bacterium]HPT35646.1 D-cysteine desulfhydrase family protein [Bacillota bacterium]HPZ86017.1 D-cysteine desulfhydrase family protein [Bacillota bacterium]